MMANAKQKLKFISELIVFDNIKICTDNFFSQKYNNLYCSCTCGAIKTLKKKPDKSIKANSLNQ